MGTGPVSHQPAALDGRSARRERGRLAVTEAMIELVSEGAAPPNVEDVAKRAGVSVASLFRYFETLDDLRRATSALYFDRYSALFDIPNIGEGTLESRVRTFVSARVQLHEKTEPMARLARMRAPEHAAVDDTLQRLRATLSDQVRHHFDAELGELSRAARDDVVMIVATLTSFEAWHQAQRDHSRSSAQIRRAWTSALTRLLWPAEMTPRIRQ